MASQLQPGKSARAILQRRAITRACRQLPLTTALLFVIGAIARGATQPVGHVVELNGDWFVYASSRGDASSKKLSKWDEVPAGSVIRAKEPSTNNYLSIVDENAKELLVRLCRPTTNCLQPIYLPETTNQPQGTSGIFGQALHQVWNLLAGGEYERSMNRVRGPLLQTEYVLSAQRGRLDLSEAMRGNFKGQYTLVRCQQEASCGLTKSLARPFTFDWLPDTPNVSAPARLPTGLYEISLADDPDRQDSRQVSVRILICSAKEADAARLAFAKAVKITESWSAGSKHAFLRAYLAQLNRNGVCTSP